MTLLEIDAFLAVTRWGTISAAAEKMFITQPALSRRISILEHELGYTLLRRGKGIRGTELTEEGRAFQPVAERWQQLWRETRGIAGLSPEGRLTVAVNGSINTYLMAPVYRRFLEQVPGCCLRVTDQHSAAAYDLVAAGSADLGLISEDRYVRDVETTPLFRERMILVAGKAAAFSSGLTPRGLDPAREIRLDWNPEYDAWHDYWFGVQAQPRVHLDQMALLEHFIQEPGCWVLAPASVAQRLIQNPELAEFSLKDGPPHRIIYYLLGRRSSRALTERMLSLLRDTLSTMDRIELM